MAPPGFTSKKTTTPKSSSTSGGPPGTSSGKSGQDILKDLKKEISRREFFKGREDVSDDRLLRRYQQDEELRKFKREETKPVYTTSGSIVKGVTQRRTPESMGLAQKQMQLANKYGPTFSEIMSDVTYAGGKVLGALGERAMSGSLGIFGALKDVANYALDKANKGYEKLNSVQQEIFDNPDKYPYASKVSQVEAVNNSKELALEADRDALGLELDTLMAEREFRYNNPTVDMRKPTIEEMRTMPITQSGVFPAEEVKEAAIDRFSQEYLEEQKRLLEELNVMPTVEELQPQDSLSTDDGTQVTAYNNPVNLQFSGQQGAVEGQTYGNNFAVFPDAETGIMAAKRDLALKTERYGGDVDKIIGEFSPRSDNLESFDNYLNFIKSGVGETVDPGEEDELLRRVIRFENKPDIANQYLNLLDQPTLVADASKRDIKTLQPIRDMGIGYDMGVDMFSPVIRDLKEKNPTLTDEEIRGIIEGTITQPTGVFAADGGMIDKQLKSLQNGLQNMYNGIPSVKRR